MSKASIETVELRPGDIAPDFSLLNQNGEKVSLGSFKGRKLLVYFYPKADTPGCTKQSCSVSDHIKILQEAGMEAIGISPDPPESLKKFDAKYALGFPLLADEDHRVAEAYGVWGEKLMYGKKHLGIIRSAFVIDERQRINAAEYKISPGDTVIFAQKTLEK